MESSVTIAWPIFYFFLNLISNIGLPRTVLEMNFFGGYFRSKSRNRGVKNHVQGI